MTFNFVGVGAHAFAAAVFRPVALAASPSMQQVAQRYAWNRNMEVDTPARVVSQLGFPRSVSRIPAFANLSMLIGVTPSISAIVPPTKQGLTFFDSAMARIVHDDCKARGVSVVRSEQHLAELMRNARDPGVKKAYRHLLTSGAYNKIEQRDVENRPDGRSGIWNFASAASVWGC